MAGLIHKLVAPGVLLAALFHFGFVETGHGDWVLITAFEDSGHILPMGVWESNLLDENQWIKMSLIDKDSGGKPGGRVLRLDYDVDSWEKAKVGFWLDLGGKDLSTFDTLHLNVRGSEENGCARNVTIEIVDSGNRVAPYIISGVKPSWKEFQISFKRFSRIGDWTRIKELRIVFDDINSVPKKGTLFVDEIYVSKGGTRQ